MVTSMDDDDEMLSLEFLGGFNEAKILKDHGDSTLFFVPNYMKSKQREHAARKALARYLRNSDRVNPLILEWLAKLFDPDGKIDRELTIRFRRSGSRTKRMEHTQIAYYVYCRVNAGEKVEAAVQSAMALFQMSREQVFRIYKKYKSTAQRLSER